MNKTRIAVFLAVVSFSLANAHSQDNPGVAFSYISEQDSLPASPVGQTFHWTWHNGLSTPFDLEISFCVNGQDIGGQGTPKLEGDGTLSVAVAPIPMAVPDRAAALYGCLTYQMGLHPGGKKVKIKGGGGTTTYYGNEIAGLPQEQWPSKYIGTPLHLVLRDGLVEVGKKTLLAESTRPDDQSASPNASDNLVHEFSVYVTVAYATPSDSSVKNTENTSAPSPAPQTMEQPPQGR